MTTMSKIVHMLVSLGHFGTSSTLAPKTAFKSKKKDLMYWGGGDGGEGGTRAGFGAQALEKQVLFTMAWPCMTHAR